MSSIVKSQKEVETFLRQFMPKLDIWGIFFINRGKNSVALKNLGIPENYRETVIRQIVVEDYVETIRMMPSCIASGQVAGTAAALALDRSLADVGAMPYADLVKRLEAQGHVVA